MTNHPNRNRLTVTITEQHLTGNDPDEFNLDKWLGALEREYRRTVRAHFPNARCVVDFDVRRASGYCRPVSVDFEHDTRITHEDRQSLIFTIENDANSLYDSRGEEFFNA